MYAALETLRWVYVRQVLIEKQNVRKLKAVGILSTNTPVKSFFVNPEGVGAGARSCSR